MKRRTTILVSTVAVAVVVAAGLVALRRFQAPDTGLVTCPTYISTALSERLGAGEQTDRWEVYAYEGTKGAPKVKVRPASVAPGNETPNSCELKIKWAPTEPGSASDWRIGHTVSNVASVRGRPATFRVKMKGSTDFAFDTAMAYIYDGVKVEGVPIPQVTRDWQQFQVTMQVDPGATTFQAWVRLLLDKGTVKPGSGKLYFVAELEG